MNANEVNVRTGQIIDAALRVHTELGPGLLESAYKACLSEELRFRGLNVATEVELPVTYRGVTLPLGYRVDLIVDDVVIVELKTVSKLAPVHKAQLLSYLRLSDKRVGLLINFHEEHLRNGIKR